MLIARRAHHCGRDFAESRGVVESPTMKVEYLNIGVGGDLGFTVGIERQEGARVGNQQNPTRRALRATQVFRKEDGAWKLLHRTLTRLLKSKYHQQPHKSEDYRSKCLQVMGGITSACS
jgi:SnoaL-like protein